MSNELLDRVKTVIFVMAPDVGWPNQDHPRCEYIARACIKAMREPTEAMIAAIDDGVIIAIGTAASAWKVAIDEALK